MNKSSSLSCGPPGADCFSEVPKFRRNSYGRIPMGEFFGQHLFCLECQDPIPDRRESQMFGHEMVGDH